MSEAAPSRAFLVPLIIACALFMEHLDSTVIATALPAIAQSFGEDPLRLNLAITAYLLSLGIFIPLSGWIADRFGARSVFCTAIVIFTLGSIGCSFVNSLPELVLARVVQGMGGAMMVPVGRLVVLRTVEKSQLVNAMAWLTVPALIGPVVGPPLGGFIATYGSWRWIFLINIPIGILGVILAMIFIPNTKEERADRFDGIGFALVSIGLAATMFGFENVGRGILPTSAVVALLAGGIGFLALYYRHTRATAAPIIDISLIRVRTFGASVTGGFLFRMGIGALPFLTPMMLQLGFGLTPFASGMITFAGAAGAIVMKFTAGPIIRYFGFRTVLLANTFICAAFMASYGFFTPMTPHLLIIATLLIGGFFRSLQFTALNTIAYADIALPMMSRATTLSSVAQQLSLSFGVGIGALLLHMTLSFSGRAELTASDFSPAYFVIALIGLAPLAFFLPLPTDAGHEVSGHRSASTTEKREDELRQPAAE
ncbi:MAG TPA: DHA2 family efflux MFS transporter permease subunit [Parvibaculum sp.]|uniref:DHA2 family efflux MFS transporter permease subunit n=1 Tax=Parvibaculum sp. TaxID=2024848 RepID=UPI002CC13538|nr:DHA2 family efflux MFS transporter permease subunit [Parvibaculum sp.]HMM15791.1 DHA2 family efflux MFS transporter permease subunit [Parvibaculum sp.]